MSTYIFFSAWTIIRRVSDFLFSQIFNRFDFLIRWPSKFIKHNLEVIKSGANMSDLAENRDVTWFWFLKVDKNEIFPSKKLYYNLKISYFYSLFLDWGYTIFFSKFIFINGHKVNKNAVNVGEMTFIFFNLFKKDKVEILNFLI